MKIANIDTSTGWRLAGVHADAVIDLNRAVQLAGSTGIAVSQQKRASSELEMPPTLAAWLSLGSKTAIARAASALDTGVALISREGRDWALNCQLAYPLESAPLAPPVAIGATVLAVGLNYNGHALEANMELPKYPMVFSKPAQSLRGSRATIPIPKASDRIDYEGELVIVIGKACCEVGAADALDYVAGFTLANDVS
ncbi:MAG: fumarylacetoacetate hydrolase family protein, partial [Amphiplicatus sp.]